MDYFVYILDSLISAFFFYLPVLIANLLIYVVYSAKGLGIPLDLYKKLGKQRIIGSGRNVSGFFFFSFISLFIGIIQKRPLEAFYLGLGGIFGCFFSSFVKRRIGLKQGQYVFLIDQADFIIFSSLFYASSFLFHLETLIWGIIVALILHHSFNALRSRWERLIKK